MLVFFFSFFFLWCLRSFPTRVFLLVSILPLGTIFCTECIEHEIIVIVAARKIILFIKNNNL